MLWQLRVRRSGRSDKTYSDVDFGPCDGVVAPELGTSMDSISSAFTMISEAVSSAEEELSCKILLEEPSFLELDVETC